MKLRIADDLALPLEAVTEKLAWLGRTGSGKSYGAQKLAEEMHAAGAQFVVLDPVGIWYGLRLAADGKHAGLPIPVLGGLHGDVPLEATGGALIANLVVDRGTSIVLDVSQFESDADKARFAHAFADRFFFRKKAQPSAVHVFIEEAQEFVPQNPQREEARMLHAFTRLLKIGRNFGIGASLISQRPQEINKKALNLSELLFVFQTTGPHERKAIEGWIADKGIEEDIAGELPKLERGAPHVWSPAFLKISRVVQIARKATFDGSSTPKVGASTVARELSPIDLDRLRVDMAATIERAKAEDPRERRRRIQELERQLAAAKSAPIPEAKVVEIPVFKGEELARVEELIAGLTDYIARASTMNDHVTVALDGMAAEIRRATQHQPRPAPVRTNTVPRPAAAARIAPPRSAPPREVRQGAAEDSALPPAKQRILDALAFLEGVGIASADRTQLALLADQSPTSGGFANYLGALRTARLIDYPTAGKVQLTDDGRALAGAEDVPSTSADLHKALKRKIAPAKWAIVEALIKSYPGAVSRDDLAVAAKQSPTSGGYANYLGSLRSLGLIDYPERGMVVAQPVLFLEGA